MDNLITENLVKSGENMVMISLLRSARGIKVSVKTHPSIEEFFKTQSNELVSVKELASQWSEVDKSPLNVWHITNDPGVVRSGSIAYFINRPGSSLIGKLDTPGQEEPINLSFLRLKGVSDVQGVQFEVKGAFSLAYLQKLAQKIVLSSRQFYVDYLKPIDITVSVNTQETRL